MKNQFLLLFKELQDFILNKKNSLITKIGVVILLLYVGIIVIVLIFFSLYILSLVPSSIVFLKITYLTLFNNNLNSSLPYFTGYVFFALLMVSTFIFAILFQLYKFTNLKKYFNWWIIITIFSMIFVFLIGFVLISQVQPVDMNFHLYNYQNSSRDLSGYGLICRGQIETLIYLNQYKCTLSPAINPSKLNVIISFNDKSKTSISMGKNIQFMVPVNSTFISVNISGINNNKSFYWYTSDEFKFMTQEQSHTKEKNFLGYLFLLFTLVFFSIPTLAVNMKNLTRKKRKK